MAKQLNSYEVKLDFKADTSQAKKEIQSLQDQLSNAINKTAQGNFGNQMSKEISSAIGSATKLKIQLQEAFNVDTGRLDLGKFKQSMDQSGMSLRKYQQQLAMLGPEGEQAFRQLASSVVQAEVPLKRSNALLKEFGTTLANTARWQISSSLLHGIIGAMSSAYGYAQDLNESLNNIRIVTGYNVDQMTDFAAAANKAAQALSTTTTSYTDAALIYYQQGLSDEEVLGRTDVTIKLANVARESAETVSDQMTAVWNNFYDGSKSLEYYADVMTALGAATASSTAEISQGLEKFAAVADTVGLSYEYATAALATVTATTRQSADVVGTAFKTLFARLEQLKLGETLDDGTTLGQYSQALEKVGVLIKDDAGNLKDMDDILDELAAKWQTLAKDQQVALAQQVAGVRQYTQLIALMDNWDFMESNLEVARGAEGTLEEQANIYAESWEAAQKRVKAAAEDIYGALLNDEFFIDLNNMLADTIHAFGTLIKGMGGMKGVLTVLGAVFVTVFRDNVSKSIDDTIYRLRMMTKAGKEALQQEKERANALLINTYEGKTDLTSISMKSAIGEQITLQESYLKHAEKMNEAQRQHAGLLIQEQQILIKNIELKAQEIEKIQDETRELERRTRNQLNTDTQKHYYKDIQNTARTTGKVDAALNVLDKNLIGANFAKDSQDFDKIQKVLNNLNVTAKDFEVAYGKDAANAFEKFKQSLNDKNGFDVNNSIQKLFSFQGVEERITKITERLKNNLKDNGLDENSEEYKRLSAAIDETIDKEIKLGRESIDLGQKQFSLKNYTAQVGQAFKELVNSNTTVTQSFVAMSGTFMTVASSIRMLIGLVDVWKDDSVSTGQKLLQTITVLSSVIMMASKAEWADTAAHLANIGAKILSIGKSEKHTVALTAETIAAEKLTLATLGYIAVAALVAAAIIGIIYLIYRAVTAEERQAKQLADTKEKAKELTDQYKELKNSAEEFRNTISDYQNGLDELENLKDNQEELNKAIEESNKKAKELIETYKLFDDYTIDTNGAIVINSKALDNIQKQKDLQVANARATAAGAQINALNQERNFAFNQIDYSRGGLFNNKITDEEKQTLIEAFEAYVEKSGGVTDTQKFIEFLSDSKNGYTDDFQSKIGKLTQNDFEALINDLGTKGIESLENYNRVQNETAEGMRHWTKELYSADFQAKNYEQLRTLSTVNGEFSQARYELISAVAGIKQDAIQIADTSSVISQSSLSNWISSEGHTDIATQLFGENWGQAITGKNLIANYAALHSGGNANDYDITKNSDGQYTARNIYTQEEAVSELTEEAIAKLMAAEMAVKEAMNNVDYEFLPSLDTIIQKADEAGSKYGVDFSNALLSSLIEGEGSLQDFNLSSIMAGLDEKEWTELKSLTPEQLADLFGITEENLEALGIKSKEELYDKFQEGLGDKYSSIDYTAATNAEYEKKAEDLELDVDAFKAYRRILEETNSELAKNVELLNKVAIADKRVERGAKTLIDNWEEWNEIITRVGDNSQDLSDILPEIEEALADIANVNVEDIQELGTDFVGDNWDLITDSINGSTEALDELQEKIAGITLENWLVSIGVEDEAVRLGLQDLHAEIASFDDFPIEVPIDPLDNSDFIAKCNEMIQAAGMTSAMAQEYFSKMGFDAKFKKEKKTAYEEVADLQYTYEYDPQGNPTYRRVTPKYKKVPHDIDVLAIESITPNKSYGGNIKSLGGSGSGGSKSSGGGKSSSPAENQKITSKADAGIERYKEIDDAIEDLTKDQERLNKVTDAYYGANKISYMKQQLQLLGKEVELHKERFKWAQEYYNEDKADLDNFAKTTLGVEIEYDEDGSIKNYTSIMDQLYSQLNEKEKYWANAANFSSKEAQDEYKKANIDPIADSMKEFQKYVDTFDESNEERKKEMNEVIALQIEYKEHEYEIWQEGWKMQQEIIEDQVKFLDHAKKMIGDSAIEMGEILALTYGNDSNYIQNTTNQLELYRAKEEELHQLLEDNKITQADYIDGLMEIRDQYLKLTENLKELDDFMMEYYGKVLDKVINEVKEYTDRMKDLNEQLSIYQKIMKLTGRSLDYEGLDKILNAQLSIYKNQYSTDKETYKLLLEQKEEMTAMYNQAVAENNEAGIELYKKQLDELEEHISDVKTNILNDLANMAEKAEEIRQNQYDKAYKDYEDMMTNGMGFEYLDRVLEHTSQIQDEYLTKTNQVFETTKMLRKIQSDMDSTSNRAAKERLNNFKKEIEQLKNREKMTKADLELAQKEYDLLLAKIALEEAQQAKTTVRLQRDNEGNYGYVYTADEGNIAQAEDDYFNAENDLYNTRLRITNEYGQKILELSQQQANDLQALWEEYHIKGTIDEDTYNKKKAEILNYYQELMGTYTHNYAVAQQDDSRVMADAWINKSQESSGIMIKDWVTVSSQWGKTEASMSGTTLKWSQATSGYIGNVEKAEIQWQNTSQTVTQELEKHFGNVDIATETTKQKSQELAQEIRDDLRHEYRDLFSEVDQIYRKYGEERNQVKQNITAYTTLAQKLQVTIDKYRTLNSVSGIKTYNSDGDKKDTPTGVKEILSTPTQPTGSTDKGKTPSGGTPSGSTALPVGEVGKLLTKYINNYSTDDYNVSGCKVALLGGTYYSESDVATAVAKWMANNKKVKPKSNYSSGTGNAGYVSGKPATKPNAKPAGAARAASGMYTGDWGDDSGKLAILHRKELVLNSHDTDNMFGIIDMVREITKTIDVNAAGVIGGYGALSSGSMNAGPQTLEQNVQITASFPNATNHSEIEEAFNNLINKASQYANRTR